jgi:hypothetical protein
MSKSIGSIILIKEENHPEIPRNLIFQKFDSEIISNNNNNNNNNNIPTGIPFYLRGPVKEIRAWIRKAGGRVWTSNNPMAGNWNIMILE